jgi:hypothetical protein
MRSMAAPTEADPATGVGAGVIKSATVRGGSLIEAILLTRTFGAICRCPCVRGSRSLHVSSCFDQSRATPRMNGFGHRTRMPHSGLATGGSGYPLCRTIQRSSTGRRTRVSRPHVIDNRSHSPYTLEYPYTHSACSLDRRMNYCQRTTVSVRMDAAVAGPHATREEGR